MKQKGNKNMVQPITNDRLEKAVKMWERFPDSKYLSLSEIKKIPPNKQAHKKYGRL